MIKIEGVSFSRGERCILDNVSCSFEAASCTMLLGPNGAGKTTLLDIAAGYLPTASGNINYDDQTLNNLDNRTLAQTRAVVSQRSELSFPFQVRDVVLFGRNPFNGGHPSDLDHQIVETCLDWIEAKHLIDKNYLRLSGGEQQMVHVARALAQIWQGNGRYWHQHLFLDEALSNLDLQHQATIGKLIRSLCDKGCCVVMVIHDLNLAARIGDHFVLLANREIQSIGNKDIFKDREIFQHVYSCEFETKESSSLALFPKI